MKSPQKIFTFSDFFFTIMMFKNNSRLKRVRPRCGRELLDNYLANVV